MTETTTQAAKSTFSGLKDYGGGKSTTLISILNSDFTETEKQYNSFCQLINDRLAIHNSLHYYKVCYTILLVDPTQRK